MRRPHGAVSLAHQSSLIVLLVLCCLLGLKGLLMIVTVLDWYTLLVLTAGAMALSLLLGWWEQL